VVGKGECQNSTYGVLWKAVNNNYRAAVRALMRPRVNQLVLARQGYRTVHKMLLQVDFYSPLAIITRYHLDQSNHHLRTRVQLL